jgi:transcriptional regulator with XRE-family HTH domain
MDIKARLQAIMDERGWTMYRVAKEADIPWSTVRNMFKRNTEPSVTTLESICAGMGITLAQFFHSGCAATLTDAQRQLVMKWNNLNEHDKKLISDLMDSLNRK